MFQVTMYGYAGRWQRAFPTFDEARTYLGAAGCEFNIPGTIIEPDGTRHDYEPKVDAPGFYRMEEVVSDPIVVPCPCGSGRALAPDESRCGYCPEE